MPIMSYGGFKRMTSFCKTYIPEDISARLELVKDNDEAVKKFGIDLGTDMCRRLLDAGTPGLHMYTLNLEHAAVGILENLGLINKSQVWLALPLYLRSVHGPASACACSLPVC
jgi:methylenetetrahydrofolate reductase (NADPH)